MEEARAKKRQRRDVVSEEEYSSTLSSIIQRDYFSDLPQLQLKAAVLARREAHDIAGAVAVRRAARKIQNHEEALEELEAQEETDTDENGNRKTARPLHRETLTGFHNRVTSEDNSEFDLVQQQEVKANRERLEALFQSSSNSQQLLNGEEADADANSSEHSPYPGLASDEYNPPATKIPLSDWKKPSARNGLYFVPTPVRDPKHHEAGNELKLLQNSNSKQQAVSESEINNNSRALMPPPSSTNNTRVIRSVPVEKHALVEYIPKHSIKRKIEPSQTRFPSTTPSNTLLDSGTTIQTPNPGDLESSYSTDASTDLEFEGRSLAVERQARARRREQAKHDFVSMTPLVVPGAGDSMEASPIFTWGTVAGTPLVVSNQGEKEAQHKTSTFRLAEESGREIAAKQAALSLEKRSARAKVANSVLRKASKETGNSWSSRGKGGLSSMQRDISCFSPAAMSLLARTSRNRNASGARSASSLGSALRASSTRQAGRTGTSRPRDSATPRVPARTSNCKNTEVARPGMQNKKSRNITAGLLDL